MVALTPEFLFSALSIVLIDVLLGGDNAVVIALVVKSLPPKERTIGIAAGAGGAVVLRIIFTFFAARLLQVSLIKFFGGLLILWIAVRLLSDAAEDPTSNSGAKSLWRAMWLILVADLTMSIDNILAVAAASKGNLTLLIFGLGLSIPFVIFTSSMLSRLMDRFPIVIYLGAAILGRVGGDMMITDPWIVGMLHPSHAWEIGVQAFLAIAVVIAGKLLARRVPAPGEAEKKSTPP
jgi:YjbE family integral membrane protein